MKFILGTKVNMTQIFDDKGLVHPVTVLKAGPMVVIAVKTISTDGYNAVQVGFGERAEKNINKPEKGHMKDGSFRYLREFRTKDEPTYVVGDAIDLSTFSTGDEVTVSSISKGKGFQGGVKRHGFEGGPRSHGQKHSEREPGSIGGGGRDGGRVAKGKRMAGRMGGDRITNKGLTVVSIKPETGEIFIRGAVAGRRGTLVEVVGK
ncbi:MAG: 50S ribosomal protein L3 [Candidatus Zambryskibacteria bacterium]|nr:50S ribosomal protein L3 [Candidatus Zambryskibacteria bacterium]